MPETLPGVAEAERAERVGDARHVLCPRRGGGAHDGEAAPAEAPADALEVGAHGDRAAQGAAAADAQAGGPLRRRPAGDVHPGDVAGVAEAQAAALEAREAAAQRSDAPRQRARLEGLVEDLPAQVAHGVSAAPTVLPSRPRSVPTVRAPASRIGGRRAREMGAACVGQPGIA